MKALTKFTIAIVTLCACALFGADTDPTSSTSAVQPQNFLDAVIPFLAPILIALVKFFAPQIPKPMLPWLAPLFGAGISWLGSAAGLTANPLTGAILGAAGVAVREAYDQAKKGLGSDGASSVMSLFGALLLGGWALCGMGCADLDKAGEYHGDKTLYTADQTIVGAYDGLHAFVKFEFENRAALKENPDVTAAADMIRANAEKWIGSAIALRDAYAGDPSQVNRTALQQALDTLRAAISQGASYMAEFSQAEAQKVKAKPRANTTNAPPLPAPLALPNPSAANP